MGVVRLRVHRGRDENGVHVLTYGRGCVVVRMWREHGRWVVQTHDVERGMVHTHRSRWWGVQRAAARAEVQARPPAIIRQAMRDMAAGRLLLRPGRRAAA